MLEIKTNNHWRQFTYREEVPKSVLADQFDWTNKAHAEHEDYSDNFFQYKGFWYHVADFMRINEAPSSAFASWHGSSADSYFSGVLIRVSNDGDEYQIGTYIEVG